MKKYFLLPFAAFVILSSFITQNSDWVAPEKAKQLKNPNIPSEKSLFQGKKIYTSYCTSCHGETGDGNGPAAQTLNPKPANFAGTSVQKQSDGELFWKITEGRGAMASFKYSLTSDQRWNLVNYLRTLK